jgi:transposase-like protein
VSFFTGVSTRKIKNMSKILIGQSVSSQKISSMMKIINSKVDFFHQKKLTKKYEYLIIDGVWIKVVNSEGKTIKKVILAAIGVDKNSNKEIIGFKIMRSEAKNNWNQFLSNLVYRGLNENSIKCIVSDQHASIKDAVTLIFPNSEHQICVCHVIGNIIKNIKKQYPKKSKGKINEIKKEAKEIYKVNNKNDCKKKYKKFIKKWEKDFDKGLKPFKTIFEETLHYFNFEEKVWNILKTSNHIERFFRDFRGRIKTFGSHFKNTESAENFFFVFLYNYNNNREFFSDIFNSND